MYPRYFFNLTDGQSWVRDEDGIELPDLEGALAYTLGVVERLRQLRRFPARWKGWRLEISDDAGQLVEVIPLVALPRDMRVLN